METNMHKTSLAKDHYPCLGCGLVAGRVPWLADKCSQCRTEAEYEAAMVNVPGHKLCHQESGQGSEPQYQTSFCSEVVTAGDIDVDVDPDEDTWDSDGWDVGALDRELARVALIQCDIHGVVRAVPIIRQCPDCYQPWRDDPIPESVSVKTPPPMPSERVRGWDARYCL